MKIFLTILMIGVAAGTLAQKPDIDIDSTYFHPAASLYVRGDSTTASNLVATGLSYFPENGKLLRLKELLDQQQQDDQNQDQDQNNDQNQDNQDQQQNDDPQNQDQNDDQNDEQDQEQEQDQNEDPQEQEQQQAPPNAEQMSEDEAQRLLDAMKQEEENKRLQLKPVMGAPVKVDKDW
jgi:hypothetical protein